jgi:glycopeptide antibiotics resistance protein
LAVITAGTLLLALYPMGGSGGVNLEPFSRKMVALRCMMNGGCRWMLLTRPVLIDWVGNVVAFVPFGAALAMATWPGRRSPGVVWWAGVLLTGVLFSAAIESAQLLLPGRSTDVDDVILNSAGAFLGVGAGYLAMRLAMHRYAAPHLLRNEGFSND